MDAPTRQDVERQLRLVLAAPEFQASPKLSELLFYLVTEALAGRGARLKGYTIGLDVFEREPGFDQGVDAIVRVQMGRLRKLMADYYLGSGARDPIRITLVRGRYMPRFDLATGEELNGTRAEESLPLEAVASVPTTPTDEATAPPVWWRAAFERLPPRSGLVLGLALTALLTLSIAFLFRAYIMPEPAKRQGPIVYVAQYQVIGVAPLGRQLARGLQYDLVNQLSKFPDIAVLGLDSVEGATAAQADADPRGADFVLGGAIELADRSVRITSQLKRTRDGLIAWSDQATADSIRPMTIIQIQASIAASVANRLGQSHGVIAQAMAANLDAKADPSLTDYRCVLEAYTYMRRKSPEQHAKVRSCLELAVAHSPTYSTAWALLSWIYGDEERSGYNASPRHDGLQRALLAAQRALATNPNNATAHQYLAIARFGMGDDDISVRESCAQALRLSPNNSEILANCGWIEALLDGGDAPRALVEKALVLNPGHPSWYWLGLAIHALRQGNKADALKYAQLYDVSHTPAEAYLLAAALRLNGRDAEADALLERLKKSDPAAARDPGRMMRILRFTPDIQALIWKTPLDGGKAKKTADPAAQSR